LTSIGRAELAISCCEALRVQDRLCAATKQFGSVGTEISGERVELFHKVVVELNEHFTSSHDHMLSHMIVDENDVSASHCRPRRVG
jgi:hypothetical protein